MNTTQIYFLEACEPLRTYQTQKGASVSQNIVVRALDGESEYTDRYVVESYTGADLAQSVGRRVALQIHGRVTEKDGRHYNNLFTREVFVL